MAVLTPAAIVLVSMIYSCVWAVDQGLHLNSHSAGEVKGCFQFNKTLAVCFNVQKDSIVIQKTTGEKLVQYQNLGEDMFYYQVLDQAFIGHGPSVIYVPDHVPRELVALRAFAMDLSEGEVAHQQETLKDHFQAAMSELHHVPELHLLQRVSAALADNATRSEILQPFHALCLNLMKQSEMKIPAELKAEPDMEDETADKHDDEKRCPRPTTNQCRGMCGLKCHCWKWVCGDCCWHRGCYEHDLCCNYGRFTSFCLFPFKYNFSCSRYGAFEKCKPSSVGWRRK